MNKLNKKYGLPLQYEKDDYLHYGTDNGNYISFSEKSTTYGISLIDSKIHHEMKMIKHLSNDRWTILESKKMNIY